MHDETARSFRTAVDGWYYVVVLAVAVALGALLLTVFERGGLATALILLPSLLVCVGLPIWLLFTTYRVANGELRVASGPFRWRIPLSEIHSVYPTRNPLSSPALSLNRLEIRYGRGLSLRVSPVDREGFLRAIGHQVSEPASR